MKKTYLKSWEQSRRELLTRVIAAFAEAGRAYEARKLAKEEREKQLEFCRGLCEKVSHKMHVLLYCKCPWESTLGYTDPEHTYYIISVDVPYLRCLHGVKRS